MGLFPCEFGFIFPKDSFKSLFFTNNDYSSRSISFELTFKDSFRFDAILFTENIPDENSVYEYAKHTDYEIDVNLRPYAELAKLSIHSSDHEKTGKVDFDVLNNTFWISVYLSELDFNALIPTLHDKDIYIDFNILCTESNDDVEDTIKNLIVDNVEKRVLVLNKLVKSVEIRKLNLTAQIPTKKQDNVNEEIEDKEEINTKLINETLTTNRLLTELLNTLKIQKNFLYIISGFLILLIFFK